MNDAKKAKLRDLGFTMPAIGRSFALNKDSTFEPPFFCVAGLHSKTPVNISSFVLMNGGSFANVSIGRYCSLANNIALGFAEHPVDRISSSNLTFSQNFFGWRDYTISEGHPSSVEHLPFDDRPKTTVGNDVWIGQGAFIKSGVTIGDGAIIAAHACVVRDVEPYTIVGGVAAKPIRKRFPDEIIERLVASKWWEYSMLDFEGISFENIEKDLDVIEARIPELKKWQPKVYSAMELKEVLDREDG